VVIGVLLTVSLPGLVAFCLAAELVAIPIFVIVRRQPLSTAAPADG